MAGGNFCRSVARDNLPCHPPDNIPGGGANLPFQRYHPEGSADKQVNADLPSSRNYSVMGNPMGCDDRGLDVEIKNVAQSSRGGGGTKPPWCERMKKGPDMSYKPSPPPLGSGNNSNTPRGLFESSCPLFDESTAGQPRTGGGHGLGSGPRQEGRLTPSPRPPPWHGPGATLSRTGPHRGRGEGRKTFHCHKRGAATSS